MATFGRARRAQGGGTAFVRPLAFLLTVSLALLLLRDLRSVYMDASGVSVDWELIGQAAQGVRDRELLDVVSRCRVCWMDRRSIVITLHTPVATSDRRCRVAS